MDEGSAMPNKMFDRIVPSNKDDSWETKESAERYEDSEMSFADLVSKKISPDCGS